MEGELAAKRERVLDLLREAGRVAVAFSAGVDSTVVAKAAALACGDAAVAVTAESDSLARGELDDAVRLADLIGIRHVIIRTREFLNPSYAANPANRCYFCKSELYSRLAELQPELGFDAIVNGANLDDQGDHRPGMVAAAERQVRSPLLEAGCTKEDVRALAKDWGLPIWDKPAMPCLSSRVAYGVAVTPERVRRIDAAEAWLREAYGLRVLRVRLLADDRARIEVPREELPSLLVEPDRSRIVDHLRSLGFAEIEFDPEGFRSGRLNESLEAHQLVSLKTLSPQGISQ